MAKRSSGNRVRVESWTVRSTDTKAHPSGKAVVTKVAVRDSAGRFHGATNFKGSVVGS